MHLLLEPKKKHKMLISRIYKLDDFRVGSGRVRVGFGSGWSSNPKVFNPTRPEISGRVRVAYNPTRTDPFGALVVDSIKKKVRFYSCFVQIIILKNKHFS